MNREILFRGKTLKHVTLNKHIVAEVGQWIYGGIVEHIGGTYILMPDSGYGYISIEVIPETVSQYTGLTDKNGVEVYEGDIIDIHQTVNGYNQFVIQYDNYKFSARYYNQKTKQILGWYQYDLDELFEINETEKEIEVIGNIYENEVD